MMHNTKRAIFRRVITYVIMITAILGLTTVLLLVMLGYRYNNQDKAFIQGGLVQFISQPTGASVRVGTADLANRTRSKITLNPGDYKVVMSRPGYVDWEKDISVTAGKVLWLNSARLVPTNPMTTPVLASNKLDSVVMHENGNSIALIKNSANPEITTISTNDTVVKPESLVIPSSVYSEGKKHRFSLVKQTGDDSHILLRHSFDSQSEWLMINTNSVDDSYKIVTEKTNPITVIQFDPSSNDRAYALYKDGTVRRINVSDGTTSDVLIKNVDDVTVTSTGSLFYVTKPKNDVVTTGYLTQGKSVAHTIDTISTKNTVHIAAGEYYDDFYIVTSQGKTTTINRYDVFPESDTKDMLVTPDKVMTVKTPGAATSLALKNNGRLIAIQQARTMTTYDVELDDQADVAIDGLKKNLTQPLQWLDAFHFWNDATGQAKQYEYDGTNQASITPVTPGYPAAYSANNKFLYTVNKRDQGFILQRTQMVL